MHVLKVITEYPGLGKLSATTIQKSCIDRGLDSDNEYSLSVKRLTDLVIADCLVALVNMPDFTEDDLSENLSRESIMASAQIIYKKYADGNSSQGTIRSRKVW